jgi:predicted kinase
MNHELESHLRELPQPFLLMGVGVPGSHKSHLLGPLAERVSALHLNAGDVSRSDKKVNLQGEVLQIAWDTASNQERIDATWDTIQYSAHKALEEGRSVIFDATNRDAERRKRDAHLFYQLGAQSIVAAYFAVDLSVAQQRRRMEYGDAVNGDDIIKIHHMITAQPPTIKEGFDKVITLDANKPNFPIVGLAPQEQK